MSLRWVLLWGSFEIWLDGNEINTVNALCESSVTEAGEEVRMGILLSALQLTLPQYYSSPCQLAFNIFTEKNQVSFFQLVPASGLKKRADRAKARKTIPPMIVTKEGETETLVWDEQKNTHIPGMFLNPHLFWRIFSGQSFSLRSQPVLYTDSVPVCHQQQPQKDPGKCGKTKVTYPVHENKQRISGVKGFRLVLKRHTTDLFGV